MTDIVFGLTGKDFVVLAADTSISRSIVLMKENQDKIMHLDDHKLLAVAGTPGDKDHFCEYIQKNIALYELRQGFPLSTHSTANFTRSELADALRRHPYNVNMLLGGYDKGLGPSLYFMDYLASLQKVEFGCQGYAGYFLLGLLDRHYKKEMSLDEALQVIKLCIDQMRTRFVLNSSSFVIKVVDKDGIRVIDGGKVVN